MKKDTLNVSYKTDSSSTFFNLGIAPGILTALQKLGFTVPTPIQAQSIPIAIEGKDLVGIAQTGTGKTLAYGIPLLQRVAKSGGRGLIVAPTRELALQIDETLRGIAGSLNMKVATLIGGEAIGRQINDLRKNPQIVIGTPGRILDHVGQKTLSFQNTNILVLDEADRMLDMGFAPQLKRIIAFLPRERQTLLFSATMPDEIIKMAKNFLQFPIRVEIARSGTTSENVTQELFFVSKNQKLQLLGKLLGDYRGSVLVFARTKHGAKKITRLVKVLGHGVAEIHGNRSLSQRKDALQGFKTGRYRVLVATDIAARGIDVTNIELVLNYDLPQAAEDYVHRIGRTARAGAGGHAISFAEPNQARDVRSIERLIRKVLPVSKIPELPPALPEHLAAMKGGGGGGGDSFAGRGPRKGASHQGARREGGTFGATKYGEKKYGERRHGGPTRRSLNPRGSRWGANRAGSGDTKGGHSHSRRFGGRGGGHRQ